MVYWAITAGLAYGRAAAGDFDLVHSNLDFHAFACASLVPTPTVTTLHGRLDLQDLPRLYARFPTMPVISISESQRAPLPQAQWVGTVYNAVDTDRLQFNRRGGTYLAWLGRIAAEKGLDRALQIARRGTTLEAADPLSLIRPHRERSAYNASNLAKVWLTHSCCFGGKRVGGWRTTKRIIVVPTSRRGGT